MLIHVLLGAIYVFVDGVAGRPLERMVQVTIFQLFRRAAI
jgi:hypothetical protein